MKLLSALIPRSSYARNIIALMVGTGVAQAIPIAMSPILTRLYSPEEFGEFAIYVSIVSILSIVITGRYELAISLPKSNYIAFHIVALSIMLSCFLSIILLIVIILFNQQIIQILGDATLANWLYWIPLSTFIMGLSTNLTYWNSRKEKYKSVSVGRIVQTASTTTTQIGLSLISNGPVGLVAGQLAGQALSVAYFINNTCKEDKSNIRKLSLKRIGIQACKYKDFPRIMVIGHVINSASSQMPIILLGSIFGATISGYYMLIQRVMGMPMALVANAFGDVFRQEASQVFSRSGNCSGIFLKTFKKLILIAILPFTICFFAAPVMFVWMFGDSWKVAGEYAQALTPMFFIQFITSPLSSMFLIAEKQKIDLFWQMLLILLIVPSLLVGGYAGDPFLSIVVFSASYSMMYVINAIIAYKLTLRA
jgi:O-antigen/teichoic acid export membrane protein